MRNLDFKYTNLKKAYANGLIHEERLWLDLLEDRNKTSHMYSESVANEIVNHIKGRYLEAIGQLVESIGKCL